MTQWVECRDCGRPLRSDEARQLGYGSTCARKRGLTRGRRRTAAVRRTRPAPVPPAADALPGQTELQLFFHQPSLESL